MQFEHKAPRDQMWSRADVKECVERRWHRDALKEPKQERSQEWDRADSFSRRVERSWVLTTGERRTNPFRGVVSRAAIASLAHSGLLDVQPWTANCQWFFISYLSLGINSLHRVCLWTLWPTWTLLTWKWRGGTDPGQNTASLSPHSFSLAFILSLLPLNSS